MTSAPPTRRPYGLERTAALLITGDQCTVREQVRTAVGELHEVLEKLSNKTITWLPTISLIVYIIVCAYLYFVIFIVFFVLCSISCSTLILFVGFFDL